MVTEARIDHLLDIDALIGEYSFGGDEGSPEDYADTFADDGVFVGRVGRDGTNRFAGRAAILAFARQAHRRPGRGTSFQVRHHQSSPVVFALNRDTAHARCYLLVTAAQAGRTNARLCSTYEDRLVRTDRGWRIAERRVGELGSAPTEALLAPFIAPQSRRAAHDPAPRQENDMAALAPIDRLEILDVVNRWSHVVDGIDRSALHRVMTDDAVFERDDAPPAVGLEPIAAALWQRTADAHATVRTHVRNTIVVESATDRVVTRSYYLVTTSAADGAPITLVSGTFEDEVVRVADGWRIRRRKCRSDFAAAPGARDR